MLCSADWQTKACPELLRARSSGIRELPEELGMPSLRTLDLSGCGELRRLPPHELTSLTSLTLLTLQGCAASGMPASS